MDYRGFIKRLDLPEGFNAPDVLAYEDLRAKAITRADLADDVAGINRSLELIRRTRGGTWPSEPVTDTGNYVDLVWHELEFREQDSFTYAVRASSGRYLGCCYLYPMGRRVELTDDLIAADVDVSWWVVPDAYDAGEYTKLYRALRHWVVTDYPFTRPYFSNREIPEVGPHGDAAPELADASTRTPAPS
jgi:hypothetical protein